MSIIPDNILKCMDKKDRIPMGKSGETSSEIEVSNSLKSEKDLQNQIASYLRLHGIAFSRSRMDKRSTTTLGWPDFVFAIGGNPIAFECKMPGKKPDKEQEDCHLAMKKNGWQVYLIFSFQEAVNILKSYALHQEN